MGETTTNSNSLKQLQGRSISQFSRQQKHKGSSQSVSNTPLYPPMLMGLLKSRRHPNRLLQVYTVLETSAGWFSAEEINLRVKYVKRTLQGILNKLVERNLVKKTRSLSDARVTLFSAVTVEKALSKIV